MKKIIFTLLIISALADSLQIANAQWVQMSGGMGTTNTVYSFTTLGNNIFAGNAFYGIFRSTNNGGNWTATGLTNYDVNALAVSGTSIFAGIHYYGVYRSTNNGVNWTASGLTDNWIYAFIVSGTNIFAGTLTGVYRSTNNGVNWTLSGLASNWIYALAVSGTNIFAGTLHGVYRSTNNGGNWTASGLTNYEVNALAVSGTNIFAGTLSGVYRSINNGGNWTASGLANYDVDVIAVSGTNIFAGTHNGIFLSTNNGEIWLNKNQGFVTIPTFYSLLIANNYIFAGTSGKSVWRRSFAEIIGINNISSEIPSSYNLHQNYPNPFNPTTKIKFDIPGTVKSRQIGTGSKTLEVKLIVYDILGKEIQTLVNEKLNPGTYETEFNGENYPNGIYFYRLETSDFVQTRKMLMIK